MRKHMKRVCHCTLPGCMMMLATTMMLMAAPALMPVQAAVEQAESQVTGLVTDPDKQPLVGVTVTVVSRPLLRALPNWSSVTWASKRR